jgi:serine/threonine protein kinase
MTAPLRTLLAGHILSDYRIDGILGQGGFGITYLATDTMLGRKVAIKEYYPREFAMRDSTQTIHAAGDKDDQENFAWGLDRFLDEARTLARFDHPNIVAVTRFFKAHGTAYLVMDYCEGEPLDEIIKRDGPLTTDQLDRIITPLLDGLEHIHATGVMHRDIKPANIFIRADGSPVLLDFGAARQEIISHSRSVTSLATAGYAPLEQYSTHGKQGPWSDIYGLGATLYRAVTGNKPLEATDRILDDTLVPAAEAVKGRYPTETLTAIDTAMAVRSEQRPQTIAAWRPMFNRRQSTPRQTYSVPETPAEQPPEPQKSWLFWALVALIFFFFFFVRGFSAERDEVADSADAAAPMDAPAPIAAPMDAHAPAVAPGDAAEPAQIHPKNTDHHPADPMSPPIFIPNTQTPATNMP